MHRLTSIVLGVAVAGGCSDDPSRAAAERAEPQQRASAPTPAQLAPAPTKPAPKPVPPSRARSTSTPDSPTGDDWREWLGRVGEQRPTFYDRLLQLEPIRTRAGTLRFVGATIRDPDALPVLLHRLVDGNEAAAVRVALADALPRTGGAFGPAAVQLLQTEDQPAVRVQLAEAMRRVDGRVGRRGLRHALEDPAPEVRAAAARTVARRPDGDALVEALIDRLSDDEAAPRQAAARSLGALRADAAQAPLARLLDDPGPDVRLHALRALGRIAPEDAARLPAVEALRNDEDPRVARVARSLTAGQR